MLTDGFRYLHGSVNTNLKLPITADPNSILLPEVGELVFNVSSTRPGVFIYDGRQWVRAINTATSSSGEAIIPSGAMPAFSGDVSSEAGTSVLTLTDVFPEADTSVLYNAVSVNKKGLVTSGSSFRTLTEFGITPTDGLLLEKEDVSNKNMTYGYAGLDEFGHIMDRTLPQFSGDLTSIDGTRLVLNTLLKPFIPVVSGDIDPMLSVAGTYNKVSVNEKGLVVDGIDIEMYNKSEIDALLGTNIFNITASSVNAQPIDPSNSVAAIVADPLTINSKKGDVAIIEKLGTTYIKGIDRKIYSNVWTTTPSTKITTLTVLVNGNYEVLSFTNAIAAIDHFYAGVTPDADSIVYLVGLNTFYTYTSNAWLVLPTTILNDTNYNSTPITTLNANNFLNNSANALLDNGYAYISSISTLYQKHIIVTDVSNWVELPQQYGSISKAKVLSNMLTHITLSNTSEGLQIVQDTDGNQSFTLPKASTSSKGGPVFVFINNAIKSFDIKSYDDVVLTTASAGSNISIFLVGNNETDWIYIAHANKMQEIVANKSIDGLLAANSDTLYPSQKAVKTYVDSAINTNIVDVKGHSVVTGGTLTNAGLATLDENNKLTLSQLPASALTGAYKIPSTFISNGTSVEVTVNNYQFAISAYQPTYNIGDILIIEHIGYVCLVTGPSEYTIIEKNVIYVDNEYSMPDQMADKFNADIKYKVINTTRSYTWNGTKYVQINTLFDSHTYIVDRVNATKSDILTAPIQFAQKNDIAYILAEKKSYVLTADYLASDTDQQKIDKWVELTASGNYINSAQSITLSANTALNKNSPRLLLVSSTGNWVTTLPDATTLPKGGMLFVIKNTGTLPLIVNSFNGSLVRRINANQIFNFYLTDNLDTSWFVSESTLIADSGAEFVSNKNIAGGYVGLDSNGKILSSQLPPLAITDIDIISDPLTSSVYKWPLNTPTADMTLYNITDTIIRNTIFAYYTTAATTTPQKGDIVILSEAHSTYILSQEVITAATDWIKLNSPTDSVISVATNNNGVIKTQTGLVTVNADDIGAIKTTQIGVATSGSIKGIPSLDTNGILDTTFIPSSVVQIDATGEYQNKINPSKLPLSALTNNYVLSATTYNGQPLDNINVFSAITSDSAITDSATTGDIVVSYTRNKAYILRGPTPTNISDWVELQTGTQIESVNGKLDVNIVLGVSDIEGALTQHTFNTLSDFTHDPLLGGANVNCLYINKANGALYVYDITLTHLDNGVSTPGDYRAISSYAEAELLVNKSIDGTLVDNSDTLYPSQKAVKTYVDRLSLALTGDVTASATQLKDGTISTSLSNTGVTPGVYNNVTVDSKGRVTAASTQSYGSVSASDLTSGTLDIARLPALTGDISSIDGSNIVTVDKIKNYGITGTAANNNTLVFDSASNGLSWSLVDYNNLTNKPTNVSAFTNDSGYQIASQVTTLANSAIIAQKGVANGLCDLDANLKVPLNRLPDSILGQLEYKGVFDFASQTLPVAGASNTGWYYIASNTLPSNGYSKGDWAVSNGATWDKIDNTSLVSSVAGRTGAVVLTSTDVGLGNVTNDKQLKDTQKLALTGDITSISTNLNTGSISTTLSNTGVTPGVYNNVTVDSKGRVIAASNASLSTVKIASWDGSVQLEKASSQVQSISMNHDNLSVILPQANLFDLGGFHYVIANSGYHAFIVVNYANESICIVQPNASVALLLLDNTDAKGKWEPLIGNPSYSHGLQILDSQTLTQATATDIQNAALSLNSSVSMYISLNKLYATLMDHQATITLSAPIYLVDATEITSLVMLTGTLGVIVYKDLNANYQAARVVVSASSVSLTSTIDISGFSNYALSQIDDSHALLVSSNPTLYTTIFDASVSLTKSSSINSNIPSINDISLCNIVDNKYFVSYQKSSGIYATSILNIVNGIVSFSTEAVVSSSNIVVSDMVKTSIHSALLSYHTTSGYSEVVLLDSSTYKGIEEVFVGLPTRLDLGRLQDIAIVALAEKRAICAYSYQGALNLIELSITCGNISIAQQHQQISASGLVSLCRVNNTYSCTFTNNDGYPVII